jgi:lysophospholipase L1-like esterase
MTRKLYKMPDNENIACLGDSITAGFYDEEGYGYVPRLAALIAKDFPLGYGIQKVLLTSWSLLFKIA